MYELPNDRAQGSVPERRASVEARALLGPRLYRTRPGAVMRMQSATFGGVGQDIRVLKSEHLLHLHASVLVRDLQDLER